MRALAASIMTLGLGLAQAGCGAEDDPPVVEAGSARMDGTGFVSVEDGTEVTLIPGAQSGFHVWLNVRVRGLAGELQIERSARRRRDGVLVFRGLAQRLDVPDTALDAWWESPVASPAFMCPSPIGIQVFDESLVFEVRILDMAGVLLAEDTLVLTPHCPAGEQEAFCRSICAG